MRRLLILLRAILRTLEKNNRDQVDRGGRDQRKASQQTEARQPPIVAELHVPKAALDRYDADNKQQNEQEIKRLGVDRKRLLIEGLTLGFVVLATIGAFANLYFLKRSVDETKRAADASIVAARAARDGVLVASKAQRAWVHRVQTNLFQTPIDKIETLRASVPIINSGELPARNIDVISAIELLASNQSPSFAAPVFGNTSMGVLFPDERFPTLAVKAGSDRQVIRLTPEDRKALMTGRAYVAIYGRIIYEDDFGLHWTRFCVWNNYGPGQFSALACTQYNSVGDGPLP